MPYAGWMSWTWMDCGGNSISTSTHPDEHLCLQHSHHALTCTWFYMGPKALYSICMCAIKRINKIMLMTNCFVCITQARQHLLTLASSECIVVPRPTCLWIYGRMHACDLCGTIALKYLDVDWSIMPNTLTPSWLQLYPQCALCMWPIQVSSTSTIVSTPPTVESYLVYVLYICLRNMWTNRVKFSEQFYSLIDVQPALVMHH